MVKQGEHWAVIGGGMMGLALARRLAQHDQQVSVLESRPSLGGLADAWQLGDVTWDRHYHVTLLSDSELRKLLDEIGLTDEMRWVETRTGFYTGGKFYSMSSSAEFLKFPPLTLIEKLRLGGTIFLASKIKNWRRMEQIPVETWLRRWSGNSTFEKIWLPLLRAKLGEAYQRTSAAFIWSYISRMYKARRTGLKKEMFGYVRGGYARVIERMTEVLEQLGVDLRLNQQIDRVDTGDDGRPTIHFQDGTSECFDHVLFSTASNVVAKLCPTLPDQERELHENVEYLGIVCASVLLRRPLEGYYVTNITDPVPFTAVIEMTAIVTPAELRGHSLIYLPKYVTQEDPIFHETDDSVMQRFIDTLLDMYPYITREDILTTRISRVRNVMAIPTLRYSEHLPPMQTSLPGVLAINSAHILKGNLNVNETLELADEAFANVVQPLLGAVQRSVVRSQ